MLTRPDAPGRPRPPADAVPGRAAGRRGRPRGAQGRAGCATRTSSTGCARSRRTLPGRRLRRPRAPDALDLPPLGWVNLHFSLLPAWRGAAPVQHAVLHGDDVTGATTFLLEEGLDTGPVLGRAHRGRAPARHQRRPARPAGRTPAPGCWSPPSTRSSAASSRPSRSRPTASRSRRSSPATTHASTGRRPPSTSTGWSARARRRRVRGRPGAATASGSARSRARVAGRPSRRTLSAEQALRPSRRGARGATRCWSAAATARSSGSARCARRASGRWPPTHWARGVRDLDGARFA